MSKFDKGFSEKLDEIGKTKSRSKTTPQDGTTTTPIEYKKVTFHNRSNLQDRLQETIDKLAYEKRVHLSQAILIRYALTSVLDSLDNNTEESLAKLATFEQSERAVSSDRYAVNRGLQEYVQR